MVFQHYALFPHIGSLVRHGARAAHPAWRGTRRCDACRDPSQSDRAQPSGGRRVPQPVRCGRGVRVGWHAEDVLLLEDSPMPQDVQ